MKEDDVQMSALMKEFKKDQASTVTLLATVRWEKWKKNLNEEKKMTWTDLNQDTTSIQALSDCDGTRHFRYYDFSVALDKS